MLHQKRLYHSLWLPCNSATLIFKGFYFYWKSICKFHKDQKSKNLCLCLLHVTLVNGVSLLLFSFCTWTELDMWHFPLQKFCIAYFFKVKHFNNFLHISIMFDNYISFFFYYFGLFTETFWEENIYVLVAQIMEQAFHSCFY